MPSHGRPRRAAGPQGPAARRGLRALAAGALAALALAAPALGAADSDPYCTGTGYGDEPAKAGPPVRFGVDPELAGTVGSTRGAALPLDDAKDIAAIESLTPPGRQMVLRVNRLFWADGEDGIRRFEAIVARHDAAGFDSEIQVRYHPAAGDEGNLDKWVAYVRRVVDVFGADRRVVAMTITNEVNLNVSQNTSDGAYAGATDALVQGIVAARAEADRIGRRDMKFGFTYAYRWQPGSDAKFWTTLGAAPDAFRRALDYVGADIYPGTFYPPVVAPTSTPGRELDVALGTIRSCFMPKAKLGPDVPIWITENGYQSGASGDDAGQASALEDMLGALMARSGTYNVSDYRWFNLRDNRTGDSGLFTTSGLLRDDYSEKPAFAAYRSIVARSGAARPAAAPPAGAAKGIVSLTFDDGTVGQRAAARLLARHRMGGTFYVNSGRLGLRGYLTWADLRRMQRSGQEIGGHTLHHTYLPGRPHARAKYETCADRRALVAHGLRVRAFAYPEGRSDAAAEAIVKACGYESARRGSGGLETVPPADPYATRTVLTVLDRTTLAHIERRLRDAARKGLWAQLLIHRVCTRCTGYTISPKKFGRLLDWLAKQPGLRVEPVSTAIS